MEKFIELSSDVEVGIHESTLSKFWMNVQNAYPTLAREVLKKLLPVVITYLCKTAFLHYVSTKTKYRSRLDAEADVYIQLSSITPDIKSISTSLQVHPSQ